MDWNDNDYESLLRDYRPRRPSLPIVAVRNRSRSVWLVAATTAAVIVVGFFLPRPGPETQPNAFSPDSRARSVEPGQKTVELNSVSGTRLEFEVSSVKPTPPQNAGPMEPSLTIIPSGTGTVRRTNATLRMLVRLAYDLQEYQVLGGPPWADGVRFDVEARAAGKASREEVMRMLQTLLAERFRLQVHREAREGPVFHLVAARSGVKAKPAPESSSPDVRIGRYFGRRSMAQLAQYLGSIVGRPVEDRTGLSGPFEIELVFTPEQIPIGPNGPIVDPNGPSVFTAIQEQLGLRLESARGMVETLLIAEAERPDPN